MDQLVLIVEDSDDDYEVTLRALKKNCNLHNPVYRCETGQEAIDYVGRTGKYKTEPAPIPSVILLDLNMPGKDGRDVLKYIKTTDEYKSIPVIILTTSSDDRDVEKCYELGANTYIVKPVDFDKFIVAIRSLKEYWFNIAILPKRDM